VSIENKGCEDCGLTLPSFGLPSDGTTRWCFGCVKGHAGAVDVIPVAARAKRATSKNARPGGRCRAAIVHCHSLCLQGCSI
jgi:hypothetical protein